MISLDFRYCHEFSDHIHHFSFSPLNGIIWIVLSFILVLSCIYCQLFAQSLVNIMVFRSVLVGSDNLSAYTTLYMLKGFLSCFNFCLFPDYEYFIFPSEILFSQVFLFRILSLSSLELLFIYLLKYFSSIFILCYFLT